MRHLSTLLLFLSCVIYVIQSSDPAPEPHPSSEPQPHTPEPHAPQPHTPEPHTPEPHPAPPHSEPQPHAPQPHTPEPHPAPPHSEPHPHPGPEPHPHPAPHPHPGPQPAPIPTVDDFYIEPLATAHNFEGISHGAVALTGMNDTISIFGGLLANGSVADYVLQYTISTGVFVNASYWNPMHHVISYSQAPTDPVYYLLKNMTEYSVWSFDGVTHQKTFNITFKPDEVGSQIAAVAGGGIYVYGSESGLWWWDGKELSHLNVTNAGSVPLRSWPALVAYGSDLFLHGGSFTDRDNTTIVYGDFWYYTSATRTWSPRNNVLIPPSSGHTATLSVSQTPNFNSANIYFSGLSTGTLVNFDINANSSSIIMGDLPSESVATINGNRMFIYGGKLVEKPQNTLYQIVNEKYCTGIADCESCVSMPSCTWCKTAVSSSAPSCVSGSSTNPWILKTCAGTSNTTSGTAVISMVEYCPEIFPSWAIALIVIGGVILVGGIVFGIMKLRSGKPGYEPV